MVAVRLFARSEYRGYLQRFGCELIEALKPSDAPDGFHGWAYWRTSWGHHFYVPEVGPDALCPEHRIFEILSEISEIEARLPRG